MAKNTSGSQTYGYLPCFSRYKDSKYSLENFYRNGVFVSKVSCFMSKIILSNNIRELINQNACKSIQKIQPNSAEGKRIINECSFDEGDLYRAKWGSTPYRLIFGLDTSCRRCYIFMLDPTHSTYSGKTKR